MKFFVHCFLEDLVKNISDLQCTSLIDESTDVTPQKQVYVIVRYLSTSLKKVLSAFLRPFMLEEQGS